jgi:hypothetical protein
MVLTDTGIKKAKPQEKAYRLSNGKGMFLFVTAHGREALEMEVPAWWQGKTHVIGAVPRCAASRSQRASRRSP